MKNERIVWIDYLKSFACMLVCLGHLIQSLQKAGIDNYEEITSFINWFIYLFHMPLFMCMSGFLYHKKCKRFSWKEYRSFELKKMINLCIPYFTFYLVYVGLNILFSTSVNSQKGLDDIVGMFNNPISPYWFLYALLSIFLVVPLIEKLFNYKKIIVFGFFCFLKVIYFFIQSPLYFLNQIMSYGIYFYLGCFLDEKDMILNCKRIMQNIILVMSYIFSSIVFFTNYNSMNIYAQELIRCIFAIVGIIIGIVIFKSIRRSYLLDTFKEYTFQIFLLHTIFAAGFRIVLLKLGITNYIVNFTFGMIVSIYLPVLISLISEKIVYTDFFFFPIQTINKLRERK